MRRSDQTVEEVANGRSRDTDAKGEGDWCRHSPHPSCPIDGKTPDAQINEQGASSPVAEQKVSEATADNTALSDVVESRPIIHDKLSNNPEGAQALKAATNDIQHRDAD